MKKLTGIISIIMVFVIAFSLVSCGTPDNEAKDAVDDFFKSVKNGDVGFMEDYLNVNSLLDYDLGVATNLAVIYKSIFSDLTYEIKESEVISDTEINFTVDVTMIDLGKVMTDFISDILSDALEKGSTATPDSKSFDDYLDMFLKDVVKHNEDKTTNELILNVKKDDDTWYVSADGTFQKMIEGMIKSVENFNLGNLLK